MIRLEHTLYTAAAGKALQASLDFRRLFLSPEIISIPSEQIVHKSTLDETEQYFEEDDDRESTRFL